jgi:dihydroneopterin aldolase/2-amino-4-hydroxy-6-hydroxymethyldihydropteridine diphosphokinase
MYIKINAIKTSIIIGHFEYERLSSQPVEIYLKVKLANFTNDFNDELQNTIDYDELINYVVQSIENSKFRLLESLARFVCDKIFIQYPMIIKVDIKITKPNINKGIINSIWLHHKVKRVYKIALAFGSNANNLPQQYIINAIEMLGKYLTDIKVSRFYQTKPFGYLEQSDFINCVIVANTVIKPQALLAEIKYIEKLLGKTEVILNGPRLIDIDLIFYDNMIIEDNFLQIPHKNMHVRDFVLMPLSELAPKWIHPILDKSVEELCVNLGKNNSNIINTVNYYRSV